MRDKFDKQTLTKIINADYPTETKVAEILSLYAQDRVRLLNQVSNKIGNVIDHVKEEN